jgi:thiamine biosynthesis lipoprotein
MGTRFELVLPLDSGQPLEPVDLQAVGELVMAEVDDWHRRLSRFAPDSWVSHVNRVAATAPVRCDADTWALLADARTVWRESGGAFDVTRGDGDALLLDDTARTVRFGRVGMSVDLGGIGKGHALDCCARLLRTHRVRSAFMHGGTSSGVGIGCDATGRPWYVAIHMEPDGPARHLALADSAFAVSDPASQSGPHIFDPRSGAPVYGDLPRPVVVTGPSARLCDAWSTAMAVLQCRQANGQSHVGRAGV